MLRDEIIGILKENSFIINEKNTILPDDDLVDMGLDSLNCIQLIVLLEEKYNFEFDDSDLSVDAVRTVDKIEKYILDHSNK